MYAQDNNSLPVWFILSPAYHDISINSQPFLVGIVSNNFDSRPQHWRNSGEDGSDSNDESPVMTCTGRFHAGISCHLTPTKHRHCTRDGELTVQRLQGCCIECGKKTTYLCSACMDNDDESKTPWSVTLKNDQHAFPTTISTLI